jgi:carboxypeptidase D
VKFFKNFQKIFGIKNFKIYVTGESYAGRYVPYISAAMLDQKDLTHYDLRGKSPLSDLRHHEGLS